MKKDLRTYLIRLYHYYRKDIVILFFIKFISVLIAAVCIQYLPAILLEDLINGNLSIDDNVYFMLVIILFSHTIISPFCNFLFKKKKVGMMCKLHKDLFKNILEKPAEWYDERTSGEVLSHMNNDSECINDILGDIIPQVSFRLAYGVGAVIVVFLLDVRFGVVILIIGMLIVMTRKFFMLDIFNKTEKILLLMEKSDSFLTELTTNLQGFIDMPIINRMMEKYVGIAEGIKDNEIGRIQKRSYMLISIQVFGKRQIHRLG